MVQRSTVVLVFPEDGSWPLPNNGKKEGDRLEIGQLSDAWFCIFPTYLQYPIITEFLPIFEENKTEGYNASRLTHSPVAALILGFLDSNESGT